MLRSLQRRRLRSYSRSTPRLRLLRRRNNRIKRSATKFSISRVKSPNKLPIATRRSRKSPGFKKWRLEGSSGRGARQFGTLT